MRTRSRRPPQSARQGAVAAAAGAQAPAGVGAEQRTASERHRARTGGRGLGCGGARLPYPGGAARPCGWYPAAAGRLVPPAAARGRAGQCLGGCGTGSVAGPARREERRKVCAVRSGAGRGELGLSSERRCGISAGRGQRLAGCRGQAGQGGAGSGDRPVWHVCCTKRCCRSAAFPVWCLCGRLVSATLRWKIENLHCGAVFWGWSVFL